MLSLLISLSSFSVEIQSIEVCPLLCYKEKLAILICNLNKLASKTDLEVRRETITQKTINLEKSLIKRIWGYLQRWMEVYFLIKSPAWLSHISHYHHHLKKIEIRLFEKRPIIFAHIWKDNKLVATMEWTKACNLSMC